MWVQIASASSTGGGSRALARTEPKGHSRNGTSRQAPVFVFSDCGSRKVGWFGSFQVVQRRTAGSALPLLSTIGAGVLLGGLVSARWNARKGE